MLERRYTYRTAVDFGHDEARLSCLTARLDNGFGMDQAKLLIQQGAHSSSWPGFDEDRVGTLVYILCD